MSSLDNFLSDSTLAAITSASRLLAQEEDRLLSMVKASTSTLQSLTSLTIPSVYTSESVFQQAGSYTTRIGLSESMLQASAGVLDTVSSIRQPIAASTFSELARASALVTPPSLTTSPDWLALRQPPFSGLLTAAVPSLVSTTQLAGSLASITALSHGPLTSLADDYLGLKGTIHATASVQSLLSGAISMRSGLEELIGPLASSVSALSLSSGRVWDELAAASVRIEDNAWLWSAPAVQPYQAARSAALIAAAEEDEPFELEDSPIHPEPDTLIQSLGQLGEEFVQALDGARAALRQRHPDWVRHASVSFRELLDKLILRLVSEDDLRGWPEGHELLKQGQTHKARLLYLFREVGAGEYGRFAETDVEAILQTFFALNKGTHVLGSPYSAQVLDLLAARIEGHLLLLVAAAEVRS